MLWLWVSNDQEQHLSIWLMMNNGLWTDQWSATIFDLSNDQQLPSIESMTVQYFVKSTDRIISASFFFFFKNERITWIDRNKNSCNCRIVCIVVTFYDGETFLSRFSPRCALYETFKERGFIIFARVTINKNNIPLITISIIYIKV